MKPGWVGVGFGGQRVGSMEQDWRPLVQRFGPIDGFQLAPVLTGLCLGCSLGPPLNQCRSFFHSFTPLFIASVLCKQGSVLVQNGLKKGTYQRAKTRKHAINVYIEI